MNYTALEETGNSFSSNPIADVLRQRIIPWIARDGINRVIIARPQLQDVLLPPEVQATVKEHCGPRIVARGAQHREAPSVVSAYWPEDDQIEIRIPQLLCVVEGQADIHLGNYILHCPPGFFVFIPPGVPKPSGAEKPHLPENAGPDVSCDILWFSLHRRWVQMWICHSAGQTHESGGYHTNVLTTDSTPTYLLEAFCEGFAKYPQQYCELHDAMLKALMLSLEHNLREERVFYLGADTPDEMDAGAYAALRTPHDPIAYACEYIGNHLHENLTLEKVAQKVYMSRAQFAKRFHQQNGVTFTEYTTQLRLEQAQRLLKETDYSIPYISQMVGYKSATHLYNLFASRFGVTPLQFRINSLSPQASGNRASF
jgi:AraC-like DNA-binding protein